MSRTLGLDWGERRIGVALSDEMGWTCEGIATLPAASALDDIAALVTRHAARRIVVGRPVHDDGSPSKSEPKILAFVAALSARLPDVPVETWDESNTSVEANRILKSKGRTWKESKKDVDRIAAAVMLQSWLEAHAGPARLPGRDPLAGDGSE